MNAAEHDRPRLTPQRIRRLSASDLDVVSEGRVFEETSSESYGSTIIDEDDPILMMVRDLMKDYGGVIFQGPPGTSKSWAAARIASRLAGDSAERWRLVQFHPSYQYEDFMEGFVPTKSGSFKLIPKHFVELCSLAHSEPESTVVLVIDELSRGDPGRVFGEALTYIERTKRGISFRLASGTECTVPDNLFILATMNPLDRGVDEVDMALERRFAKIRFEPDVTLLQGFLEDSGMAEELQSRVIKFFQAINGRARTNPYLSIGHTYFLGCSDKADLQRLWEHQLSFHMEKALRLSPSELESIHRDWDRMMETESSGDSAPTSNSH